MNLLPAFVWQSALPDKLFTMWNILIKSAKYTLVVIFSLIGLDIITGIIRVGLNDLIRIYSEPYNYKFGLAYLLLISVISFVVIFIILTARHALKK